MPAEPMMISPTKSKDESVKQKVHTKSSASMQRAIDRVSKEQNVKTNSPATTQRKTVAQRKASKAKASSSTANDKIKSGKTSPVRTKSSSKKASAVNPESKIKRRTKLAALSETETVELPNMTPKRISDVLKAPLKIKETPKENTDSLEEVKVLMQAVDTIKKQRSEIFQPEAMKARVDPTPQTKATVSPPQPQDDKRVPDEIPDATHATSRDDDEEVRGRDSRDITRRMINDILRVGDDELSFEFQGHDVPVTYSAAVDYDMAVRALESSPFHQWQIKMSNVIGTKRLEIIQVEIHSVDFIDDCVDMIKMNTVCEMVDDENGTREEISSGVCYLRDNYVAVLLELFCIDDESSWSILVDNPR